LGFVWLQDGVELLMTKDGYKKAKNILTEVGEHLILTQSSPAMFFNEMMFDFLS